MKTPTAEKPAENIEQQPAHTHHRGHLSHVEHAMRVPEYIPPPLYVGMTLGSIIASVALFACKRKDDAIFVGLWAPTFLALGMFSKLVGIKQHESEPD